MSAVEVLLTHLEGVRSSGQSKWVARCPGHDDNSPSLAIRECDDGVVLLHCFAGCRPLELLQAVGLPELVTQDLACYEALALRR